MASVKMVAGEKAIFEKIHDPLMAINQFRDLIAMLEHRYRTYGKFSSRFFSFPEDVAGPLLLLGPEYNRLILSKPDLFYQTDITNFGDSDLKQLAHGLLFQNGEIHLAHRRLMMPAFHKKSIEAYRDVMVELTERCLEQWQVGELRDINHEMHQLTMKITSRALFGMEMGEVSEEIGEIVVKFLAHGTNPLVFILPFNRPPFTRYHYIQTAKSLIGRIRELVQAKKAKTEESHDLLSLLIHARDENGLRLSEDELIGQANILFLAGHETTANSLSYILLLLSQHPNVMAKLADEMAFLNGATPSLEDLGKLPYLDAVIKEGLRLFPPAALVVRIAQDNFEVDGYRFPKDTWITISQYITHRMPELYENPRRFLPERWETIQPSAYEYFPFGAGSRMCIGASFASMEMKLVLAMILQKYRLALAPNSKLDRKLTVTLGFKGALPMKIELQDKQFAASKANFRGSVREMLDWA
jgi:cytochrome P450